MDFSSATVWTDWTKRVQELFLANRVEVDGFRYTRPAPSTYEHQWLWDSCFHAIAYRWIDPAMARDELLSVVAHQVEAGADAGMIPHMTYWRGGGEELWGNAEQSIITQPPLIGVAAWLVFEISHDRELLASLYPRLCVYHDWFDRRRDPDQDDLVSIIHPWEAGTDSSPRWDRAMKLPRSFVPAIGTAARKELAVRVREYACDPVALAQAGFFHVETVDYNAIRAADLEAVAKIANELGKSSDSARWSARAQAVQSAVQKKLWQPAPHALEGLAETPIIDPSAAEFIALFGGCVSPNDAPQFIARLRAPEYWTRYPIPTTPTNEPTFAPEQYWRGNTWIAVNWLIYQGLRRYGYVDLARELAIKSIELVQQSGWREYFHPLSGEGLGARSQSWTTLVLDMFATERQR